MSSMKSSMRLGSLRQQLSFETPLRLFRSSYVGAQIDAIGMGLASRSSLHSDDPTIDARELKLDPDKGTDIKHHMPFVPHR